MIAAPLYSPDLASGWVRLCALAVVHWLQQHRRAGVRTIRNPFCLHGWGPARLHKGAILHIFLVVRAIATAIAGYYEIVFIGRCKKCVVAGAGSEVNLMWQVYRYSRGFLLQLFLLSQQLSNPKMCPNMITDGTSQFLLSLFSSKQL